MCALRQAAAAHACAAAPPSSRARTSAAATLPGRTAWVLGLTRRAFMLLGAKKKGKLIASPNAKEKKTEKRKKRKEKKKGVQISEHIGGHTDKKLCLV